MRFTLATALVAAGCAVAQTTHTVMIGQNMSLTYNPPNITASTGDIVTFVFTSKNHTVTQSTFATPCTQLTNTSVTPNIVGISSGYVSATGNITEFPTWSFSLTDTKPLWFFCLQANHCQQGMVFSINAMPDKSHDMYVTNAKASNASIPNPQTLGAATTPSQNNTISGGDTGTPSSSSTPNGTPVTSGGAPAASSPGAALPNVKVPSLALGVLAVVLGAAL